MRAEFVDREGFADDVDRPDLIEDFTKTRRFDSIDFQVPILGLLTHQFVAHTAANQQRTAAFGPNGLGKVQNAIWNIHNHMMKAASSPPLNKIVFLLTAHCSPIMTFV